MSKNIILKTIKSLFSLCLLSALIFSGSVKASAVNISITPATASVAVGQNITISVDVSSEAQSINVVSGKLSYDKNLLKIKSISKSESIIKFWVQEPVATVTGNTGSIVFEGLIMNPGFKGKKGRVVTLSFEAIKEGVANLGVSNQNILANDGVGTSLPVATQPSMVTILPINIPQKIETKIESLPDTGTVQPTETIEVSDNLVEIPFEKLEIVDYPIESKEGKIISIFGKGGINPVKIYSVNISHGKLSSSTVVYYRNITKIVPIESKEVFYLEDGTFRSDFKITEEGKHAFYAKDLQGNISNIVFIDIGNTFWFDVWYYIEKWWWAIAIVILLPCVLFLFWKMGERNAIKQMKGY